ncbi:hypothetical protein Leryth_015277 [Lithospermum erythrorhizon]|nr:hypothetical protein Leryth_015277 [Lithospermum erythrorhizon]
MLVEDPATDEVSCGNLRDKRKSWCNKSQNNCQTIAPLKQYCEEDQRSSSTSSSSELNCLVDENKRLKKENGELSNELALMKRKCKELLDLVNVNSNLDKENSDNNEERKPRLFGVTLEVVEEENKEDKRKRDNVDEICGNSSVFLCCKHNKS